VTTQKKTGGADARPAALPPRRMMPVWLQNTLAGLIIFTLTLRMGLLPQFVVCALALGIAVYQLWYRRARLLWTWACFLAVALFLAGVYLTPVYQPLWFLYFGGWIFVIVALVGEGSRVIRRPRQAPTDGGLE
jgi:hypothetical protein